MNRAIARRVCAALCLTATALGGAFAPPVARAEAPDVWAITGARIVTVSGAPIERGTVVVRDGLIEAVGASAPVPADARVIDGSGLTVYPGLIDAYSFVEEEQKEQPPQGRQRQATPPSRENVPGVTPERDALELVKPDGRVEAARSAGITAMLAVPKGGIFRGRSALVATNGDSAEAMSLKTPVAEHVAFEPQGGFAQYPGSLMGVIAVIRQRFYDAGRHKVAWERYTAAPRGMQRPDPSDALDALVPVLDHKLPVIFEADADKEIRRALDIVDEFKLDALIAGGLEAYKTADALKQRKIGVLVSLNFPERPEGLDPETKESLRAVRARVEAPETAAKLERAGVRFAFESGGLKAPKQFVENAAKAVKAGLPREAAIRAMTLTPAELFGVDRQLGSIEAGKIANLVVTDGDLFDEKTKIKYVFVDGERFEVKAPAPAKPGAAAAVDATGTWSLTISTPQGEQQVTATLKQTGTDLSGTLTSPIFPSAEVSAGSVSGKTVTFSVSVTVGGAPLEATFNGTIEGNTMSGTVNVSGQGTVDFTGTRPEKGGAR